MDSNCSAGHTLTVAIPLGLHSLGTILQCQSSETGCYDQKRPSQPLADVASVILDDIFVLFVEWYSDAMIAS
jgi:hypothetical protein